MDIERSSRVSRYRDWRRDCLATAARIAASLPMLAQSRRVSLEWTSPVSRRPRSFRTGRDGTANGMGQDQAVVVG